MKGLITSCVWIASLAFGCGGVTKEAGQSDTTSGGAPAAGGAVSEWILPAYDLASTYWNRAESKIARSTAPLLRQIWSFDTGGQVAATPVISGGRVYVASEGLFVLDLASGVELLRNPEIVASASPALDGGVLYVHDGSGTLVALEAETLKVIWATRTDPHPDLVGFSSPVVAGNYVLVGGSSLEEVVVRAGETGTFRGFVAAFDKATGTAAWKQHTVDAPSNGVGVWSTPAVDEVAGVALASTGNNYTGVASSTSDAFLAMPLAGGGSLLWTQQIFAGDVFTTAQPNGNPEGDFGANPILFELGGRTLAAGGSKIGDVWVLDRNTGAIVAQRNLGPGSGFKGGIFRSGAFDGESLLFACNGATSQAPGSDSAAPNPTTLFALDPLTLDIRWERQGGGPSYGAITVANGVGFIGRDRTLEVFDTGTGEVLAAFSTDGTIATAPAIADGHVIFGSGMSWIQATAGTKYYAVRVP